MTVRERRRSPGVLGLVGSTQRASGGISHNSCGKNFGKEGKKRDERKRLAKRETKRNGVNMAVANRIQRQMLAICAWESLLETLSREGGETYSQQLVIQPGGLEMGSPVF